MVFLPFSFLEIVTKEKNNSIQLAEKMACYVFRSLVSEAIT